MDPEISPSIPSQKSTHSSFLLILLALLLLLVSGATIFLAYQNRQLQQQITKLQTVPHPVLSTTPSQTVNLQTYTNTKWGISFQYPSTWSTFTTSGGEYFSKDSQTNINLRLSRNIVTTSDMYSLAFPATVGQHVISTQNIKIAELKVDGRAAVLMSMDYLQDTQDVPSYAYAYVIKDGSSLYILNFWQDKSQDNTDIKANIVTHKSNFEQILSTFKFLNNAATSLVPTGWKTHMFASYGITLYAPSQWQSNNQEYPENAESLIRFWQGSTPDTATIQLAIKPSWSNTGDAPYLPKNYTVSQNIAAVKVDPPQKNEKALDRYQTNVYFEHGAKTYVFTCVHNWIPEQYQLCDTMLQTLQFAP